MSFLDLFIPLVAGLVACGLTIQLVLWNVAARRLHARPGEFHHTGNTQITRYGGLGLAAGFLATVVVAGTTTGWANLVQPEHLWLVLGALSMFVIGFVDDLRPLGAQRKLLLQILVASGMYFGGLGIKVLKNPILGGDWELGIFSYPVTVVWLVAMTNLINLVDGLDGLAGGISLMCMALLAYLGMQSQNFFFVLSAGMVGVLLAFLRYNFPPAKIYMGDGGAYFLGFLIGIMTLASSNKGTILAAMVAPIIALGLPIIDTSFAILRRGARGLPIFRADQKHIHHRLLKAGYSRTATVLLLYCVSLIFLMLAFAMFWSANYLLPVLAGLLFLVILVLFRGAELGRQWTMLGSLLGSSREMRRQTEYALILGRWLELEGGRRATLDELWEDFTFCASRLGFDRVSLRLREGERVWTAPNRAAAIGAPDHVYDYSSGSAMRLEFHGHPEQMSGLLTEHFSELAAEAWVKAVLRWTQQTGNEVRFAAPQTTSADGPLLTTAPPAAPRSGLVRQ